MRSISRFLVSYLCLSLLTGQLSFAQLLLNEGNLPDGTSVQSVSPLPNPASLGYAAAENMPDNYLLGPGDQIETHLIVGENALSVDYNFMVNPEGKVFYPNIGEISLADCTLQQARNKLYKAIKARFSEQFTLSLMLSIPKKVKIYVTGQVKKPGVYVFFDGSKISEIVGSIGVASGGSSRHVIVKRKSGDVKVDLYKVFYQGDTKSDIGIRLGDVIEVPPASLIRVTVMGEVPRPGQYELKGEERLKDALMMAGFVGVNSALSEVAYLKRCQGEEKFENYKLNLYSLFEKKDESANIPLTDGDIISVPAIKTFVYVYGEVGKSGRYDYVPGMRLSDYINTAGGPSAASNLSAVTVTRQENNLPKVYHIDASQIIREGKTKHDIEILAGDVVSVPRNFFYFSDFPSFANTILIALTLYNTARIR